MHLQRSNSATRRRLAMKCVIAHSTATFTSASRPRWLDLRACDRYERLCQRVGTLEPSERLYISTYITDIYRCLHMRKLTTTYVRQYTHG
jgi:hypothetical protein